MREYQRLSSDSLFHFCDKLEYICDILQNGFQPRYTVEHNPILNYPVAIPMKCFCDIPLGIIKSLRYGDYGIGITKKFAREKGITPVFYIHENSLDASRLSEGFNPKKPENIIDPMIPFFKSYEEDILMADNTLQTTRYYDEREWRYSPEHMELRGFNTPGMSN